MGKIEKATQWMIDLANNPKHGYDQDNRWGPDYDCSSAVISAWQAAGVPVKSKGAIHTGNMKSVFISCGFKDVRSSINPSNGSGLKRGDVLLNTVTQLQCTLVMDRLFMQASMKMAPLLAENLEIRPERKSVSEVTTIKTGIVFFVI